VSAQFHVAVELARSAHLHLANSAPRRRRHITEYTMDTELMVDTQTRLGSKNLGLSRFPITSVLKMVLHCKFIVELAFQHSGIWVNFIIS